MKIMTLLFLLLSTTAFGSKCENSGGDDLLNNPIEFIKLIENSNSCYNASELAKACAWGATRDLTTVSTAYEVCEKSLVENNASRKNLRLLKKMTKACNDSDSGEGGSLGRSMNAYCHLSAIAFIANLVE